MQYGFDLGGYPAFARFDASYIGEYENAFQSAGHGTSGDYVNISTRFGVDIDQWSLALYAANLNNEDGLINNFTNSQFRIATRKIGLEASYQF